MPKQYKYQKSFTFNGKRYNVRADTKKELEEKILQKKLSLHKDGGFIESNIRFSEWADTCLHTYKKVAPNTMKRYEYFVRSTITKYIGEMPISKIRPIDCQEVLNKQEGNSKYQITQVKQFLNFFFDKAVQNGLIKTNPAQYLEKPFGTKTERRSLTQEEREIFLRVSKATERFNIFLLMYYCGCRPAEAIKANGGDIVKKGDYHYLHIRGTKSKNADRMVPIPEEFYQRIKNTKKGLPIAPNDYGNYHSDSSYKRCFKSLKRAMNIEMGCKVYRNELIPPLPLDDDFVPYFFRHTYCTDLQKKGIDIRMAQKLMGHSDISLTANIYTHFDDDLMELAAQKINRV